MVSWGSAANSSARAKAGTLVADTARSFCRSLACLAELVGGKAGYGSQRDAEAIADNRLRRVSRRAVAHSAAQSAGVADADRPTIGLRRFCGWPPAQKTKSRTAP